VLSILSIVFVALSSLILSIHANFAKQPFEAAKDGSVVLNRINRDFTIEYSFSIVKNRSDKIR